MASQAGGSREDELVPSEELATTLTIYAPERGIIRTAAVVETPVAKEERKNPTETEAARKERRSEAGRSLASDSVGRGRASYYSTRFAGWETASGETFDPEELTAAHPSLPFGSRVRVTNLNTGRSTVVRINDRGPYVGGRVIDVSHRAARDLGMIRRGTAMVKLELLRSED